MAPIPRDIFRPCHTLGLSLMALALAACEGTLGEPQTYEGAPGGAGAGTSDAGTPLDLGPVSEPDFNPFEGGGATIGVRCTAEGPETIMVFTRAPASCQRHAEILASGVTDADQAIVVIPSVTGPTQFEASGEVCLSGQCASRSITVQIDAYNAATGAIGRWATPLEGRTAGGQLQATECNVYDSYLPGRDPNLVPNLSIADVAFYQSVKSSMLQDTSPVKLVVGRPGIVRVFVQPQPGFLQTSVVGELLWDRGDGVGPRRKTDTIEVAITSVENNRGSTFDFLLDADEMTEFAEFSFALRLAPTEDVCGGFNGDTSGARFPTSGTRSLNAEPVGALNVVLVPFRYNADGSGRLPDTSEDQLEIFRNILFAMFPITDLALTVREPVDYDDVLNGNTGTWGPFLSTLRDVRRADSPPSNVYYYGLMRPTDGGGLAGTNGLASLADSPSPSQQTGVGLGYTGRRSALTMAHEIGHNGGRRHAPCGGAGNPDPNYPYEDGSIGVWGFDITNNSPKDPAVARDLMGYCNNDWISDYNYSALYNRFQLVNNSAENVVDPALSTWRSLFLGVDDYSWGAEITSFQIPYTKDTILVAYLDSEDNVIEEAIAYVTYTDHSDALLVDLPAAPEGVVAVDIDGARIPY